MPTPQPAIRLYCFALLAFIATGAAAQPKITSFTPVSAPVGTTVTINGSGFNATPANNTVYFGSVKAIVTGGSPSSITVRVPGSAPYQPVSVLNNATGLTAYSSRPFLSTFNNPTGSGDITSGSQGNIHIGTGSVPYFAAAGDINGNGMPDFVIANSNANTITIQPGSFSGSELGNPPVSNRVDFAVGASPRAVAIGDVDGDGKPDVVTANAASGTVSVLRNTSTSGFIDASFFTTRVDFAVGFSPFSVAIGDLDGDGRPDLVTANAASGTVSVLRNTTVTGSLTTSSFASKVDLPAGNVPRAVTLADLNRDGKPEIIAINEQSNTVSILRNVSSPGALTGASFAAKIDLATGASPAGIATGDLDDDGRLDLVVTNYGSHSVSVIRNLADPGEFFANTFAAKVDFATGSQPFFSSVNDANGDGKPDIITANTGSNTVSLLRNNAATGSISATSFAAKTDIVTGAGYPICTILQDFSQDGIPEVLTLHAGFDNFSITYMRPSSAVPVITSLGLTSGITGTQLTINGFNFNQTAANNIVYFGATKATVSFSSTTYLAVTIPSGTTYQAVSVLNTATGLTGYSAKPFVVTFPHPFGTTGVSSNFFRPPVDFTTGTLPYFIAAGDLDGDGKADMVTVNANDNTVSVIRNTAGFAAINAASFAAKTDLPAGADPRAAAIGDIDGDGKLDIVVANAGSSSVSVLRNVSVAGTLDASSFASKVDFTTGANPFSVAIADLDADGRNDLVVASNVSGGFVSVLRNTGSPGTINASSFAPKVEYAAGGSLRAVAVSDLNGDSKPDIAVINSQFTANAVSILRNTSVTGILNASSFAAPVGFLTGASPSCLVIGDMDGDSKPDLVVTNYNSNSVSVLRNITTAGTLNFNSFAARVDYATGPQPFFVAVADAEGDGKPDLLVVNAGSNTASVLRNTAIPGTIDPYSFADKVDFATGGYPISAAVVDADNDNVPELLVASAATNKVSVLKAGPIRQPPVIASFAPASGPVGTTVTITGSNFNPTPANNTVYFGAVKVPVTGGTATSLTVTIPAWVNYQPVSVLDNITGLAGFYARPFVTTFTNPFGTGIPSDYYQTRVDIPASVMRGLEFGDLDGDGKIDMVTTGGEGFPFIALYRNISTTGSITPTSFAPPVTIPAGGYPGPIVIADIDGDGKRDLVIGNFYGFSFSVLRNQSTPGSLTAASFAPRVDFATDQYPGYFFIKDEDGDGKPDVDVYYAVGDPNKMSVYRNTSVQGAITSASFTGRVDYIVPRPATGFSLGDLDGDGRVDKAAGGLYSPQYYSVVVSRNLSDTDSAVYAADVYFPIGGYSPGVSIADIDGDGIPELATINMGLNAISILKAGSPSPATVATAAAPARDAAAAETGQQKGMLLYPNPTSGESLLQLSGRSTSVAQIEVLGANGNLVEKQTVSIGREGVATRRINFSRQPAGVYYVKVTGVEGVQVIKVVVQR